MDFSLSPEEQLLAETVNEFASARFSAQMVRAWRDGEPAPVDAVWKEMADLGWLGVLVDPEHGGVGGSMVDAALIAEGLARNLAPVPFLGSALVCPVALRECGGQRGREGLSAIAAGARVSPVLSADLSWPPSGEGCVAWDWRPGSSLLAFTADGAAITDDLDVGPAPWSVDPLHPLGVLPAPVAGVTLPEPARADVTAVANTALSAHLLGVMDGALRLATEHAKSRHQFGQPIGRFQAIQHLLADSLADVEGCRSATYVAAWAIDHAPRPEALRLSAIARLWASEAAMRVCQTAVQVHGGMGITWECDVHLFLRQAHLFGGAIEPQAVTLDTVVDWLRGEMAVV